MVEIEEGAGTGDLVDKVQVSREGTDTLRVGQQLAVLLGINCAEEKR